MLTIPDQKKNVKTIQEQIEEEEQNNASLMFQEGWQSEELPSMAAQRADKERIIKTF